MALKVLVLGGTTEGRRLSERLVADARFDALLSFAGRTASLQRPAAAHRVGGFGGASGLADFLRRERFDALVDATHPFAAQISANAVQAAECANLPLIRFEREAWRRTDGDDWRSVQSMREAAQAIGAAPRRVFLSIGRQEVAAFAAAPQHAYLIRAIDAFEPGLTQARVLARRGPFTLEDELQLLSCEAIEVVVSKNAGSDATYAKVAAARRLSLPVVMVERPQLPAAACARTLDAIVHWLEALHHASLAPRGA